MTRMLPLAAIALGFALSSATARAASPDPRVPAFMEALGACLDWSATEDLAAFRGWEVRDPYTPNCTGCTTSAATFGHATGELEVYVARSDFPDGTVATNCEVHAEDGPPWSALSDRAAAWVADRLAADPAFSLWHAAPSDEAAWFLRFCRADDVAIWVALYCDPAGVAHLIVARGKVELKPC